MLKLSIILELWDFLKVRKKWWLSISERKEHENENLSDRLFL